MEDFNPHEIDQAILATAIDQLENDDLYTASVALATAVYDLHPVVADCPRWADLWDQLHRNTSGVCLNYSQGLGKLRGFCQNDWLCARGELREAIASMSIGPPAFQALKEQAKGLYRMLDRAILSLAQKPPEKSRGGYSR